MSWLQLANKTAIITGASSGIGRAAAKALSDAGCHRLSLADVCTQQDIDNDDHYFSSKGTPSSYSFVQCDVSNREQVDDLMRRHHHHHHHHADEPASTEEPATSTTSILVNCAGITRDGFVDQLTEDDWDQVVDVNLKGTFYCCQSFLKYAPDGSTIVNIGSIVSEQGNIGQVNYAASKGGVLGLTRALAKEVAFRRQIRVNSVIPGFIDTPMSQKVPEHIRKNIQKKIALQRFGTPDDVANLIAFLASDRSRYITGETIECSGMISL